MSEKPLETKNLKAEATRLRKDVASAQSSKSPIDLNSALKNIQSSSLPHEMKEELLAVVNKALTDLETAQAKSDIRVNNALSNQKEPLKTAKFEQDKFDTEVKPIFDEFDKFHEDVLRKQTTHSDLLEKARQEASLGKGISEETKKALLDSQEVLKNEKARLEHIRLTRLAEFFPLCSKNG